MLYILAGIAVIVFLFILTHLRPLGESDVQTLANKRRNRNIVTYFSADSHERRPDIDFKKSLDSNGRFYKVHYPLHDTPSTVAALLKYKKHEWIILGFEKDKKVDQLWVNKGVDNSSACIGIPLPEVDRLASQYHYSSVLLFHNHPNPNPNRYSCTQPSPTDLNTATRWAETMNPKGVNVVKYICERGRPYRYFISPANSFYPLLTFVQSIEAINGTSRFVNLKLHLERIF